MFGLHDKDKRDELGYVINQSIKVVSAILALVFGTAHLGKIDQQQLLKSKLTGDTNIIGPKHGTYKTGPDLGLFCYVSGSYQVENSGQYPFIVDEVRIELWEIPYIDDSELEESKVLSYSLSERLLGNTKYPARQVGRTVTIKVGEQFGINNQLQRSFGFIVPITGSQIELVEQGIGSRYVVVANASARIDDRAPWYNAITNLVAGDPGIEFLPNDLRHVSATFNICKEQG